MMEAILPRSWKEEFALAAEIKREDILHKEDMLRFETRHRVMRETEQVNERKREREFYEVMGGVLASDLQVTDFRVKLDRYDEKTVEALMENRVALEEVQKRLDDMLGKAHVLPDGRRVFKTRDGTRVFDETGLEVKPEMVDPHAVADWRPSWEQYKPDLDGKGQLVKERDELHEFQARTDAARDPLRKEGVTAKELDELDADLRAAMPEAVRRKLGHDVSARDAGPAAEGGVRPEAVPTGVPDTGQRPSGLTPT